MRRTAFSMFLIMSLLLIMFFAESRIGRTFAADRGKLVIDLIRGNFPIAAYGGDPSYLPRIANENGFEIVYLPKGGNAIVESDLANASAYVLFCPKEPYFTQQEVEIVLNFVQGGGGLYIVPFFDVYTDAGNTHGYVYPNTHYNSLYQELGFNISDNMDGIMYYMIRNVSSSHPILDGVAMITLCPRSLVCNLTCQELPSNPLWIAEEKPLFLTANCGLGRVFVDLTNCGIGYMSVDDNEKLVKNALLWISENSPNIPEITPFLILPLFMIATLIAVIVYRRKYICRR